VVGAPPARLRPQQMIIIVQIDRRRPVGIVELERGYTRVTGSNGFRVHPQIVFTPVFHWVS
jgi:hypothetical protein